MPANVETRGFGALISRLTDLATAIRSLARHETVIGTDLFYAKFVEEGTRPHLITPKNKQALYWPGAAHPVRLVHHPGTKPNPFLERTADQVGPVWAAMIEAGLRTAWEGAPLEALAAARDAADAKALAMARANAPVKRGTLRDSLKVERLG